MTVIGMKEDDKIKFFVKGCEKREWLLNIFDSDDLRFSADYVDIDIDSLNNLDVITNTMRCVKHVKNCML